jgi:hypothetical protein
MMLSVCTQKSKYFASLFALAEGIFLTTPLTSHAAIAHIDDFKVTLKQNNPPMGTFYHKIEWQFDMTWSAPGRNGEKSISWIPNSGAIVSLELTTYGAQPGNDVTGTRNDAPRTGGKYRMRIAVYDTTTFQTYASNQRDVFK